MAAERSALPKLRLETFFVTCAPGIEPLLHGELRALRLAKLERQVGGARFEGTIEDAWRVNLWSRVGVRVLLRLTRFDAATGDALHAGASAVDWSRFVRPGFVRLAGCFGLGAGPRRRLRREQGERREGEDAGQRT